MIVFHSYLREAENGKSEAPTESLSFFYSAAVERGKRAQRITIDKKLKTSVAFTYFLYHIDPSLKIKLCVAQDVNDNEKIKIDKLKRLLNPTEVIRTANQILTLREETEDN